MNVLIAVYPQMYRDSIVHTIKSYRPDVDVEPCLPQNLDRKLTLLQPELLVCADTAPEARKRVRNRVEIGYSDSLDATIIRDDQATRVTDISLERLLEVLDQSAILE
jgi:hypothetical protein